MTSGPGLEDRGKSSLDLPGRKEPCVSGSDLGLDDGGVVGPPPGSLLPKGPRRLSCPRYHLYLARKKSPPPFCSSLAPLTRPLLPCGEHRVEASEREEEEERNKKSGGLPRERERERESRMPTKLRSCTTALTLVIEYMNYSKSVVDALTLSWSPSKSAPALT